MATHKDTIVAVASAPGRSAIAVIRLSGKNCQSVMQDFGLKQPLTPRTATVSKMTIDGFSDKVVSVYFKSPSSFTGEDCVELYVHGNPTIINIVLQHCHKHGARPAKPGEFSERAFINGKMDLVQAEALDDLINAESKRTLLAASRSLSGEFVKHVTEIDNRLNACSAESEAHLDFSDEDIDLVSCETLAKRISEVIAQMSNVTDKAQHGRLLSEGYHLALTGNTNSGKSTLMNVLCKEQVSIVSNISGTTRDVIKERLLIGGIQVTIYDTAGIRNAKDSIEQEGIQRAHSTLEKSDRICFLFPLNPTHQNHAQVREEINKNVLYQALLKDYGNDKAIDVVATHADITKIEPGRHQDMFFTSAPKNQGIDALTQHWQNDFIQQQPASEFSARSRHIDCLKKSTDHLQQAVDVLNQNNPELVIVAEELRLARRQLAELTGGISSDELLGIIFSQFCIGK